MQEVPANLHALNSRRKVWFEPQGMRERFRAHVTVIPLGGKPLRSGEYMYDAIHENSVFVSQQGAERLP